MTPLALKIRQLYLHGGSNMGKSTMIRNTIFGKQLIGALYALKIAFKQFDRGRSTLPFIDNTCAIALRKQRLRMIHNMDFLILFTNLFFIYKNIFITGVVILRPYRTQLIAGPELRSEGLFKPFRPERDVPILYLQCHLDLYN